MNKTVLLVDDDDLLRQTLARGLRDSNFLVINAENAESALEIMARLSVDIIILDRMMVGMDGLTFLKKIRADGNKTPVIMLTAMGGAENTIDGLTGGADDYLSKPFQFQELVLRINNILRHTPTTNVKMPDRLVFTDNEFFVRAPNGAMAILSLSDAEKQLLQHLTAPIGNIVSAPPMVAKRLRNKLNSVLSNLDIITVRGRGYKLVCTNSDHTDKQDEQ